MKIDKYRHDKLKLIILALIISELLISVAEAKGGRAAPGRAGGRRYRRGGVVYVPHGAGGSHGRHKSSGAAIVSHTWSWFLICNFTYFAFVRILS